MSVPNPLRNFAKKSQYLSNMASPTHVDLDVPLQSETNGHGQYRYSGNRFEIGNVSSKKNYKKAQNHIGSVHAAAMALLAESSTGFVVGVNLPGDKLPLIKEMNFKYVKRAQGDMHAVAHLTDEQIALMQTQEKGEVTVAVKVTDAQGIEPVLCEMIWAWVPKSRK